MDGKIIQFPVARRKEAAAKSLWNPLPESPGEVREISSRIPQAEPTAPKFLY